jgi:uncharacterized membrane protein YfcA
MGWFGTKNKQQHVQVVATAWDMQRIEERERKRRFFIFLDIIAILSFLLGAFLLYLKEYIYGSILILIAIFIGWYFIFRKRTKRYKNFSRPNRNNRRNRRFQDRRHRHHKRR